MYIYYIYIYIIYKNKIIIVIDNFYLFISIFLKKSIKKADKVDNLNSKKIINSKCGT